VARLISLGEGSTQINFARDVRVVICSANCGGNRYTILIQGCKLEAATNFGVGRREIEGPSKTWDPTYGEP
jgi:hypothetical protein